MKKRRSKGFDSGCTFDVREAIKFLSTYIGLGKAFHIINNCEALKAFKTIVSQAMSVARILIQSGKRQGSGSVNKQNVVK